VIAGPLAVLLLAGAVLAIGRWLSGAQEIEMLVAAGLAGTVAGALATVLLYRAARERLAANVEIRSKLSQSAGRITGTWEERTFNATGNAVGQASGDKISLQISCGVSGTMLVSYSGSRQNVAISTQGIALKSVTISLSRS